MIVLDDSAGSSDDDGVLDLAQDHGKAPVRMRSASCACSVFHWLAGIT